LYVSWCRGKGNGAEQGKILAKPYLLPNIIRQQDFLDFRRHSLSVEVLRQRG